MLRPHKLKVHGNSFIPRKENRYGLSYYGLLNFKIHFIYTRAHVFTMEFNKIKNSRSVNGMIITQVLNKFDKQITLLIVLKLKLEI